MASTPGFEPGPHWWEASALNTAPPLLNICSPERAQTDGGVVFGGLCFFVVFGDFSIDFDFSGNFFF